MNVLIIQHEYETPAGSTLEWLQLNNVSYQILMAPFVKKYPSHSEFDGVIILGGSMNVDQTDLHPWLLAESIFIKSCIDSGKKTLGLCLGSQLIAAALGAKVGPMNIWEIGWFDIHTEGQDVPAFHFHRYNFDMPAFCTRTATSSACPNQAYKYKDHVLAFQFHPEVDAAWIDLALTDWDSSLKGAVQSREDIIKESFTNLPIIKNWYHQQLQRFFIVNAVDSL
jgi:GMP synthase-like glutamine amidotransferase